MRDTLRLLKMARMVKRAQEFDINDPSTYQKGGIPYNLLETAIQTGDFTRYKDYVGQENWQNAALQEQIQVLQEELGVSDHQAVQMLGELSDPIYNQQMGTADRQAKAERFINKYIESKKPWNRAKAAISGAYGASKDWLGKNKVPVGLSAAALATIVGSILYGRHRSKKRKTSKRRTGSVALQPKTAALRRLARQIRRGY